MITEEQIKSMKPAEQVIARRRVEIARKVRSLMSEEMSFHRNKMSECDSLHQICIRAAKNDQNYTNPEGVRKAVSIVAPELLKYATAFPEYAPKADDGAVAQGGSHE